ncbi:MAG: DNA polymerase III subunit delta [Cytophagales bacterium]|nr:DNA polymerase III subunit delta [Cytophagales bacterium]
MHTPEKILSELKSKKYASVYFLQGEEPYYIDSISNYVENNVLSESEKDFNLFILYGKDVDMSMVLSNARRFPVMAQRQVVIVREAQEIKDIVKETGQKQLEAYIQKPLQSTILVFCYKKLLDGRKRIAQKLKELDLLVHSKKIYDNQIPGWITSYLRSKGFSINTKATIMLAEFVGSNLSRLANEIDKLLINLKEKTEINEDIINRYIGISKEYNVFELQNALIKKDTYKSNQIVNYFDANPKKNPVIPIISILFQFFTKVMLVHQFSPPNSPPNSPPKSPQRGDFLTPLAKGKSDGKVPPLGGFRGAVVRGADLAGLLAVNPYFIKDYLLASKNYPLTKLTRIIHHFAQADLRAKGIIGGNISEGQILKELVFKILH